MVSKKLVNVFIAFLFIFVSISTYAQNEDKKIGYKTINEYTIAGIQVEGVKYLDNNIIVMLSGLNVGETIKIPGDKITQAIKKLWEQEMFQDIEITYTHIIGKDIYLKIKLSEHPRLSKFAFKGIKKGQADDLRDEMKIEKGDVITDNVISEIRNIIKDYYIDKGYLHAESSIQQKRDTTERNSNILIINVDRGERVKIEEINFVGNSSIADNKLRRQLKETKQKTFWRFWKPSKYIEELYEEDKQAILSLYNKEGFRDARIEYDSLEVLNDKRVKLNIKIHEGNKYYIGNISWVGNTKYKDETLSRVLDIKRGDVYNQERLEKRLYMDMEEGDVHSLYMNQGYLFSDITPVEKKVRGDTIDLEIRIYEGKQAIVKRIIVKGNTKTHDHVILREIRTKPGQLFNRSDVIRTQRELAQLQYFNQETLGVNPIPNPADGTVDIEYTVEETSSDQIEMSIGWGLGRLIGTVGVSFNNFSTKGLFDKDAWNPVPAGDGQKLSLRMQSNGVFYQSYNISFTEPWLGGKKPNALSVSAFHSVQSNGLPKGDEARQSILISGASIGLGRRLKWPDNYFMNYFTLGFQRYDLKNYGGIFTFDNGVSNSVYLQASLSRNSIDKPLYPTTGSEFSLSVRATPPYSLMPWNSDKDYLNMEDMDKYKWNEYHKWNLNFSWYTGMGKSSVAQKLILHTRAKFGFLGFYNEDIGDQPFERFYLGGDGLSGYSLDGRDLIGMRGYDNNSLTPRSNEGGYIGGNVYTKYSLELRYPISLNPMATIYVMGFVEAGNAQLNLKDFNPYDVYRSAGIGARIYLPMFGLLGLDWGYGFDEIPGFPDSSGSQFHFSINGSID